MNATEQELWAMEDIVKDFYGKSMRDVEEKAEEAEKRVVEIKAEAEKVKGEAEKTINQAVIRLLAQGSSCEEVAVIFGLPLAKVMAIQQKMR